MSVDLGDTVLYSPARGSQWFGSYLVGIVTDIHSTEEGSEGEPSVSLALFKPDGNSIMNPPVFIPFGRPGIGGTHFYITMTPKNETVDEPTVVEEEPVVEAVEDTPEPEEEAVDIPKKPELPKKAKPKK